MTFLARCLAVGTTGGAGERVTTFLRGSGGAGERVTIGGDDLVDAVVADGWSKWRREMLVSFLSSRALGRVARLRA
jgi:hypothetical protein